MNKLWFKNTCRILKLWFKHDGENQVLLVREHSSISVRDAYLMGESRLYFPKNTEPPFSTTPSL